MVFSSGLVTYGRGMAVVCATGMDSEIGKIATLLNLTEEQVKVNLFRARQKVKQRYLEIDEYGL